MPNLRPNEAKMPCDKVDDVLEALAQFDEQEVARQLDVVAELEADDQEYIAYELINNDNAEVVFENLEKFPHLKIDHELAERLHLKGLYDDYKYLFEDDRKVEEKEKEVA